MDALKKAPGLKGVTIADSTPAQVRELLPEAITVEEVDHEELKQRVTQAAFVVRTGETTPFANVVLRCGVPF